MAFNKEKVMEAARKFVDKGQIDKAVKEYLRIVREDPKDVRVWLKIGDLYAKKGSKQEASETYLKVARFYQEQGFYLKAVAVYKQILKLDPRLVEVNLKLAELYRQLGLLSDAMQHFELVAAHFHRDGKTKEALATVRQLVDLDPENVATRIKLAELYSKEGMTVEAVTEFTAVCETLRKQNRQDDFIKVAERLLWHKPELRDLNRELASLYLRRNDPRRALQKLQICFKADPRDVETLALLAQAFQALDQKSKTVSVLKELARVFDENKQRDKADDVHRKILAFVPNDAEALAYLGDKAKQVPAPTTNAPIPKSNPPSPKQKINFTSEVEALRPHMTGAMPLVDEKSLSDDFALPEYAEDGEVADADFASDMEIDESSYSRGPSSAGEEHADEISKILTETDVYLKYGLHQKAVEHLRRVFALDPENIEAREKLKEVYLAQGREDDAVAELMKLAESTLATDPERAEGYLREVLSIDGSHRGAIELARRHRLDLSGGPQVEVIDGGEDIELDPEDLGHGAVAAVEDDIDFDDIDFGDHSKPHHPGAAANVGAGAARAVEHHGHGGRADSFDGIDPGLFAGQSAPVPRVDLTGGRTQDGRRLGSEGPNTPMPERTVQLDPAEAHRLAEMSGEPEPLEFEPDAVDVAAGSPPGGWGGHHGRIAHAVDAQLDDALGDEIDQGVAEELSAGHAMPSGPDDELDLPFDPAAARAFDAGVQRVRHVSEAGEGSVPTFDPAAAAEFDRDRPAIPRAHVTPASFGAAALPARSFDAYPPGDVGPEEVDLDAMPDYGSATIDAPIESLPDSIPDLASSTIDEDDYQAIGDSAVVAAEDVAAQAPVASFEDDLDEADFYVSQGMYAEAVDLLRTVLDRHPNHPLVIAKLRDAHAYATGGAPAEDEAPEVDETADVGEIGDDAIEGEESAPDHPRAVVEELGAHEGSSSTQALGLEEIEELGPDDIAGEPDGGVEEALHGGRGGGHAVGRAKKQQVVLERPVEDGDADTHYDLGLAYKEMGLWDEAIKAFNKVAQLRGKEVQCRLMIGLCHREQGNHSEAVHQFKLGLHETSVTDREKQSLFYEIGATYEALGDPREALYYFEMVVKRDPSFLDASDRAARLRAAAQGRGRGRQSSDDSDVGIDGLVEDSH